MIKAAIAFLFVVAACGGDDGTTNNMQADAAGSGSGSACTGAVYDPCTDNSQCESQNCHFYMQSNITVCTAVCSATNPCPNDAAGNPVACNNMGNCKPTVANTCTR